MKISIYKGISPLKGDIAYTSIDSNGTPGYLNRYVLEELGYSVEEDLPKFDTLKISGVTMISYPEKNPIVFVVTINNEEKTENLSEQALYDEIIKTQSLDSKRFLYFSFYFILFQLERVLTWAFFSANHHQDLATTKQFTVGAWSVGQIK